MTKFKKGNLRTGIPAKFDFECDPKDFKSEISKYEREGIVIKSIETQATRYRYTINYYEERSIIKDEEWRDIPGEFYGLYQISSLGRLRSIRVLKEYERYILTDGNAKRHNVKVIDLKKLVFKN